MMKKAVQGKLIGRNLDLLSQFIFEEESLIHLLKTGSSYLGEILEGEEVHQLVELTYFKGGENPCQLKVITK